MRLARRREAPARRQRGAAAPARGTRHRRASGAAPASRAPRGPGRRRRTSAPRPRSRAARRPERGRFRPATTRAYPALMDVAAPHTAGPGPHTSARDVMGSWPRHVPAGRWRAAARALRMLRLARCSTEGWPSCTPISAARWPPTSSGALAHDQGIALPVKDYWAFDALVTVSDPRGVENLDALDRIYHWTELIQSSAARGRAVGPRGDRRRLPSPGDHDARAALQPDEAQPRRRARPRPHHPRRDPRSDRA